MLLLIQTSVECFGQSNRRTDIQEKNCADIFSVLNKKIQKGASTLGKGIG